MIDNRKNDSLVEREVAAFLDEHLYKNTEIIKEFARTDGINEQVAGSDVILSTTDGKLTRVVVDEKVASTQANRNLGTFTLELSFINKAGNRMCGWFTDTSKITEYYLFGWINKADIPYDTETKRWNTDMIRKDNIHELEWALVSRKKILSFLEKKGWTFERLGRQDEKIRQNGCVTTKDFIDDVAFRYSEKYREKPVNLMLKKETYMKLSDYNGKINC